MYISADKEDSLVQGDVCLDIPLPIISSNIRFFDIKAEKLIGEIEKHCQWQRTLELFGDTGMSN